MNARTLVYPLVALGVVGALIVMRPAREDGVLAPAADDAGSGGGAPADLPPPPEWIHRLPLPEPPEWVLRTPIPEDPVRRWFERMLWAPSELVNRAERQVVTLDAAQQRRFFELVLAEWRTNPQRAVVFLAPVATFGTPETNDWLLEAATHMSLRVRNEAARALGLLAGDHAVARAEQLLRDPDEGVRRAAVRALVTIEHPAALEALQRYADTDPEEGLEHVIARLARSDDPAAISFLRRHAERDDGAGDLAMGALARFGDLSSMERMYRMVDGPSPSDRYRALIALHHAPPELLEVERIAAALTDGSSTIRTLAGELVLLRVDAELGDERADVIRMLERLAADSDLVTSQVGLLGLFRAGRRDVAEPYLRQAATAGGVAFHNAVDFLTVLLQDERAEAVLLERLRGPLDPIDRKTALVGLSRLKAEPSLPYWMDVIRAAGPGEATDANGMPLSQLAGLHLPELGAAAVPPLLELLAAQPGAAAELRALDALRGIGDPRAVVPLIDLALDVTRDPAVRAAALESLPYHDDPGLFAALNARLEEFETLELARLARRVLYDYA